MGRIVALFAACSLGCASAPSIAGGDVADPLRIVGSFQASIDVRSDTWHLAPGSTSRFARVEVCDGAADTPSWRRDCQWLATDGSGQLEAVVARGVKEIRGVIFDMPTRDGVGVASPRLTARFDGGPGATAFRYGQVEELVAAYLLDSVIDPADALAVDLGSWRLTVLAGEPDGPAPCGEGAVHRPLPPDPTAVWAWPLLCHQRGEEGDTIATWRPVDR